MASKSDYQVKVINTDGTADTGVTFAASATTSSILEVGGAPIMAIILPSAWTNGVVSIQTSKSPSGPFFVSTDFSGTDFSVTANSSRRIPVQPAMFASVLYVQLVCSIAQVSACVVDFEMAPIFSGIKG